MLITVWNSSLLSGWLMTLAVIVAFSVAVGADASTSALLFVIGVTPVVIIALIGGHAAPPSVAEILCTVEGQDRGR